MSKRSFPIVAAIAALLTAGSVNAQVTCCTGEPTAVQCVTGWTPASEIAYPLCHDEYLDYTDRSGDDTFIAAIMESFTCVSGTPCYWNALNSDWADVCVSYENLYKQLWEDYIECLIHNHPDVIPTISCTDPNINFTCIPNPRTMPAPGTVFPIYVTPTGTPFDPENPFKPTITIPIPDPPNDWSITTPTMTVPWPFQKYQREARLAWLAAVDEIIANGTPYEGTLAYPTAIVSAAWSGYDDALDILEADFADDMATRNVANSLPPCVADWNGDSGVDGDDVTAFYTDWGNGTADVDFSGGTDGDDVTMFFACWEDSACW